MLIRKIEHKISEWISNGKKALLVDGARQVGKTYSIRKCLSDSELDFVEINLIDNIDALPALSSAMTVQDLVINLSALTGHRFIKNETIIFIDEIQELPDLVTRIKFWVDEGSYRYILSGSLLGVELNDLRSAPVGYVREIRMFPLDFEEFMTALGVTEEVIDHLKGCFNDHLPVTEAIHNKIMQLFNRYLVVGGMPEAVEAFSETGDINRVGEIQQDILQYYKRDYTKYESYDKKLMLNSIYELIPAQLLKQNRRFNYADIKKGLRFERVENSFVWLYKAGVVLPAFNASELKTALKLSEKSSLVKLYYSDIGLLTYSCGESIRKNLLYGTAASNLGGIYENAVIQQLNTHNFSAYYYNSKKLGELDFVIEYDGMILPIEVKSGKDYYVHSAINNVVGNPEFSIDSAYVFTAYDVTVNGNITYYPVYMSTFLQKDTNLPVLDPIVF